MSATGLQMALAGGILLGCGLALLVWRLLPVRPDLTDSLNRLGPLIEVGPADRLPRDQDRTDRLGRWAMRTLPPGLANPPGQDLALVGLSPASFMGRKLILAALGLTMPSVTVSVVAILGIRAPIFLPLVASLGLAAVLFMLPDWQVKQRAGLARAEFARALSAYIDLVALERHAGSGSRQALEVAADVGDSWVFLQLKEELAHSNWSGQTPWDALHDLSERLGLPDLTDLADIMRLSGAEGAQVYGTLRARAVALRAALLNNELSRANETAEKLSVPVSVLGVVFLIILIGPALFTMLSF
ncbi:MAG: hypothetical protein LBJ44_04040 [Propionibacteriaceae bacterium]|jgi:pilus assembly protein TadC|nr:hypothetical protein [Propionibacteriaceae bacterium]